MADENWPHPLMFNVKSIALIKLLSNAGWIYHLSTWWTQGRCPGMLQIGQRTWAAWVSRVLENYLISSFWICIFFVQYVICVFYLCLCLIESMSPRPSNHLSSALTPDILDTILRAENGDHQDKHHKYIGRTTNNTLGNTLEEHEKYIKRVWNRLLSTWTSSWHSQFSWPAWWHRQQYLVKEAHLIKYIWD